MNNGNFFRDKRVLVAGGAGFVGVNLIKKLLEAGARVRATIHKKGPVFADDRIEYVGADLTRAEDCARVNRDMQYVFMCAANTSGAAVMEKTPLVHVTPNILMNTLMLEAAQAAGVLKYLYISSNAVYPPFEHPVKEDEMLAGPPFEKYFCVSWMKRFSEILCEMYAKKIKTPFNAVVVRPANIYGPYDDFDWETSHVIPALIRKVMERHDPIEVWGDGNDIKDLIYIEDLVGGLLLAMGKLNFYDPVNLGTGVPVTVKDVLRAAIASDGYKDPKIAFNTSKPTMIQKRLIDVSKAKEQLNFAATTSLEDGIKKTVAWYKTTYPNGYH